MSVTPPVGLRAIRERPERTACDRIPGGTLVPTRGFRLYETRRTPKVGGVDRKHLSYINEYRTDLDVGNRFETGSAAPSGDRAQRFEQIDHPFGGCQHSRALRD